MVLLMYCSLAGTVAHADVTDACPPAKGVAVQILGSGGPIADDDRASAAYLVWVDGESRVLIDAGGGAFLRFGEAGASFSSLDFIGLSHFHTDHSADFPALLKSGYFSNRRRSLIVTGPDAGGPFPGLDDFLASMLGRDGAYGYLSGYLDGSGGLANIAPFEISKDNVGAVTVSVTRPDTSRLTRCMCHTVSCPHWLIAFASATQSLYFPVIRTAVMTSSLNSRKMRPC